MLQWYKRGAAYSDFELVITLLEDACQGLLDELTMAEGDRAV